MYRKRMSNLAQKYITLHTYSGDIVGLISKSSAFISSRLKS
ncbi:hypothetical protein PAUR_a1519 [Pseudoalteromonas aurantia 208]|uniref:Uncharacterized protein n=1 Tax=Pseudoalteromonas aurantia 208 TaxID=1314867 RepID=A0ABR9EAM0_9GAMM|nr:hypothetical protein [Pseudoalteromonas aurantia 208]